jgi:hypothetical protein
MRMSSPVVIWLLTAAQDGPITLIRFFNDSSKAANFYVDGHFGCFIPANPEGNNAFCDVVAAIGRHCGSKRGKASQPVL